MSSELRRKGFKGNGVPSDSGQPTTAFVDERPIPIFKINGMGINTWAVQVLEHEGLFEVVDSEKPVNDFNLVVSPEVDAHGAPVTISSLTSSSWAFLKAVPWLLMW